jgi:copper resistance protein B
VAGVRQDFEPGPSRTWAAVGVQGLAPYWFEVELTGYVGASGRTHLRGEVEYELLLTNRLVLQPLVEVELYGESDPERGIGAGLSTTDIGLRLRYEFKREFAPYIGVTWNNKWGQTGDFARAAGDDTGGARFVTGLRLWF